MLLIRDFSKMGSIMVKDILKTRKDIVIQEISSKINIKALGLRHTRTVQFT